MPKTSSDRLDFYLSGLTVRHISICLCNHNLKYYVTWIQCNHNYKYHVTWIQCNHNFEYHVTWIQWNFSKYVYMFICLDKTFLKNEAKKLIWWMTFVWNKVWFIFLFSASLKKLSEVVSECKDKMRMEVKWLCYKLCLSHTLVYILLWYIKYSCTNTFIV